jgi:hypothetical protein
VLLRERGWTTRQVADEVQRSPAYVSKRLRVFENPVLAHSVLAETLAVSLAEELLPLTPARKRKFDALAAANAWNWKTLRKMLGRRFGAKRRSRWLITARILELRKLLHEATLADLTEPERRALRLLWGEVSMLARAPFETKAPVPPSLPLAGSSQRKRTG